MIRIFDYVFYRVYNFFSARRDPVPESKGAGIVSLLQYFTLLVFFVAVRILHPFPLPKSIYLFAFAVPIVIVNAFRYENIDIQKVRLKWAKEEEKARIRNGWIISLYLVVSFLIPVVYGTTK